MRLIQLLRDSDHNVYRLLRRSMPLWILAAILIVLIAGCAVSSNHGKQSTAADARWVQLPMINYASTPHAGQRAGSILTTLLGRYGLSDISRAPHDQSSGLPDLDPQAGYQNALDWARAQDYRYGVTGTVAEWQYKTGLDGAPAIGLSLRVIDIETGAVIWSGSGSRAGWGYSTVSGAAQKVLDKLVGDMPLRPGAS